MDSSGFINFAIAMLTASALGLVGFTIKLRADLSDFQLEVSKEYADKGDVAKLEKSIDALQSEVKSMLEILYELRADLRAGHLVDRTRV